MLCYNINKAKNDKLRNLWSTRRQGYLEVVHEKDKRRQAPSH
mgnify:CR=1 FL=1